MPLTKTLFIEERFQFVRTGRPDHCPISQLANEIDFFQEFCWKTILLRAYYLTDLAG